MKKIYLIPDLNRIEESAKLIKCCDGAFEYNDFYNPLVLDDIKLQSKIIDRYSRYRTDFSIDTMHGAFLDVTVHSQDPLIREVSEKRIVQSMDIAKEMKLRAVVFHTGRINGFRDKVYLDNWMKTNVAFFRRILEMYPEQSVFIENMFDESPDILTEFAIKLKDYGNFGVCFDYAHANVYGENLEEWFESLSPFIKHIHINDNDLKDDLHLALGKGKINWNRFEEMMCRYKTDSSILIEVNGIEKQLSSLRYISDNMSLDGIGERIVIDI